MDQLRQRVGVGGFHFGELAMFEDFLRQFVNERQFFQHFGGGRAPAVRLRRGGCRFSLSKSTSASCCVDLIVELEARQLVNALFERRFLPAPSSK